MANLARATSLASKMKLGAAFFQEISPLMIFETLSTTIIYATMFGPGKNLSPNLLFELCIIYAVFGSHGTVILGYYLKLKSYSTFFWVLLQPRTSSDGMWFPSTQWQKCTRKTTCQRMTLGRFFGCIMSHSLSWVHHFTFFWGSNSPWKKAAWKRCLPRSQQTSVPENGFEFFNLSGWAVVPLAAKTMLEVNCLEFIWSI